MLAVGCLSLVYDDYCHQKPTRTPSVLADDQRLEHDEDVKGQRSVAEPA